VTDTTAPGAPRPDASHPPARHTGVQLPPERWSTGRLLSAVARRAERDWNAWLAHWDLNHASLPVLYLLVRGPMSQRELALASGVTEQTMSRILARLERQALIERQTHPVDRRRHAVVLTDSGRVALNEAGDPVLAEELTTRGMTPDQVVALRGILLHMLEHAGPRPGTVDDADGTVLPDGASGEGLDDGLDDGTERCE
jgi:DNA-binding MarR family transcriptional regulator